MTTLVFGHKSPDTDSTGSPIIWAWYLSEIKGTPAKAVLLGEPNTEAAFVLRHWGLDKPEIIADVTAGQDCVVVDTNNPAELPPSMAEQVIEDSKKHAEWEVFSREKLMQGADLRRYYPLHPDAEGEYAEWKKANGKA